MLRLIHKKYFFIDLFKFSRMKDIITVLVVFFSCFTFCQIDGEKKPLKLTIEPPKIETPENPQFSPDSSIKLKSYFDSENKPNPYAVLPKEEEKVKSILDTSTDLKNRGEEIKDKLNNEIAKEGNWNDVFFGKYIVRTSSIKIKTRDFADPDGDRVRFLKYQYNVL